MEGGELNYHPRPSGIVEGVCKLFVAMLHEAEDGQIALMVAPRTIISNRTDLSEDALAESLQRHLAKLAKGLPIRFRHIAEHEFPRRLTHQRLTRGGPRVARRLTRPSPRPPSGAGAGYAAPPASPRSGNCLKKARRSLATLVKSFSATGKICAVPTNRSSPSCHGGALS